MQPRFRPPTPTFPYQTNPSFETFMHQKIQSSKNGLLYSNAIFLAELLQQAKPSKTNLITLGELHFQRGNYDKVVGLLRKCDSEESRYLLGMSLYKLKRLEEAEKALVLKYCVVSEYSAKESAEEKEQEVWSEEKAGVKEEKNEVEQKEDVLGKLKENSEPHEEQVKEGARQAGERPKKKTRKNIPIFR